MNKKQFLDYLDSEINWYKARVKEIELYREAHKYDFLAKYVALVIVLIIGSIAWRYL